jgi:NAD(P)-dependent dehydrogenase (short-subunit alcohol dehydrogenase family)
MDKFEDRVAVVTGGANGIGYALAERFLDLGMRVVLADINELELGRAVANLSAKGEILGHVTDISSSASVQGLADASVARFGAVHVLCNNAGVGGFQRFATTSEATWNWILGVDLLGVIHGCRIFLPILDRQDEAHIVNTASMAGFSYSAYNHPYNVSKAGVVALSEGLYREFKNEKPHIGVSVVCPAFTNTKIADDERNAPPGHIRRADADPELEPMRQMVSHWLTRGKTSDEIAEITLQGIRSRALHVFPHREWLAAIQDRMENILAGRPVGDEPASVLAPVLG